MITVGTCSASFLRLLPLTLTSGCVNGVCEWCVNGVCEWCVNGCVNGGPYSYFEDGYDAFREPTRTLSSCCFTSGVVTGSAYVPFSLNLSVEDDPNQADLGGWEPPDAQRPVQVPSDVFRLFNVSIERRSMSGKRGGQDGRQ